MADSEEKTLPASRKKLRDARRKGQAQQKDDFVIACSLWAAFSIIWFYRDSTGAQLKTVLEFAIDHAVQPTDQAFIDIFLSSANLAGGLLIPVFLATIVTVILANTLVNRGLIFSLEPVSFKLDKLNPVEGIKRIFGVRGIVELAKSMVKIAFFFAFAAGLFIYFSRSLSHMPGCGLNCTVLAANIIMEALVFGVLFFLLVFGVTDLQLQKWLFKRDQRMTVSEQKREFIDQEGNPLIKSARKTLQREFLEGSATGIENATMIITASDSAVALRFVREEKKLPMVVHIARGEGEMKSLAPQISEHRISVTRDPGLVRDLLSDLRLGEVIKQQHFTRVLRIVKSIEELS